MSIIKIDKVDKSFDDKVVFKDFSLTIESGKNTCILGKSGQGKTTLINMIAGIEKVDGGSIDVGNLRFSFVFQDPNLLPWLTVMENIEYVLKGDVDKSSVIKVLEKLSIAEDIDSYPAELSGGMKQRVALARALLYSSDVILMDEPFQNLDIKTREQSIELYEELMREMAVNFVFVSHNIDDAVRMADEVVVLRGQGNRGVIKINKSSYGIGFKEKLFEVLQTEEITY